MIRAARDIFVQKGFAATTLQNVADAVGVTRPAVYYHFPSKLDLFETVLDDVETAVLKPWIAAAQPGATADEQERELFAAVARCSTEKRSAVAFLVTAALDSQRLPDLRAYVCPRLSGLRAFLRSPLFVEASPVEAAGDVDGAAVDLMLSILWGWALVSGRPANVSQRRCAADATGEWVTASRPG